MSDPVDPLHLPSTEENPRYVDIWAAARQKQFDAPALRAFSDDELIYISGHRDWEELEADHADVGGRREQLRRVQAFQHRARGNAMRAKDELDRRIARRQLDALDASNAAVAASNVHVANTASSTADLARATRTMAKATIAAAVAASVAALISIVALTRDEAPPPVTVEAPAPVEEATP